MQCPNCHANIPPSAGKTYCPFCRYSFKKNTTETTDTGSASDKENVHAAETNPAPKPEAKPAPQKPRPTGAMFLPKNDVFSQFEASIDEEQKQPQSPAQAQPVQETQEQAATSQHTQEPDPPEQQSTPAPKSPEQQPQPHTPKEENENRKNPNQYVDPVHNQPLQPAVIEEPHAQPAEQQTYSSDEPEYFNAPSDNEPDFIDDPASPTSKREQRRAEKELKKAIRRQEREEKKDKKNKSKKTVKEKGGNAKKAVNDNGFTAEEAGYIAANRDGYYDPVRPIIEDQLPESPLLLIAKIAIIMIFMALIVIILISVV